MTLMIPYQRREVLLTLTNRLIGGTPTDPKLIAGWLKANMPEVTEAEQAKLAATTLEQVPKTIEEESKAMWTTFKRDERGIYIESRQIKAAFKEVANILRDALMKQEKKAKDASKSRFTALRSKVAERLFVEEDRIYIRAADEFERPMLKPTGSEERPLHVMTAQGPRTALKKFDYCENVRLRFHVKWLDDGIVDEALMLVMLEHMSINGIGADRSQGNGLFKFELLTIPT